MMKGLILHQHQQQSGVEDNMSNLTSAASGDATSASSGNRPTELSGPINNYPPQQYNFAPPQPPTTQITPQPLPKKKRNLPGNPDPDAEVIALSPKTLMATNRFVCEICNKGFQRDQNLQLHRRGHNLPWKLKQRANKEVIRKKVYVCPEPSCVHHDPLRALGDLTGIKKHFCRKHGEKKWKCEKCSKRYAVQSDWKAHSKICGTREYRCDCGTLFSRRDSFITHRAFCDALAEESARAMPSPLVLSSASQNLSLPPQFINTQNIPFTLKKEEPQHNPQQHHHHHQQQISSFGLRQDQIPPWLACPPPPPIDLSSSSSSIFSTRLDQEFSQSYEPHHSTQQNPNPSPNNPSLVPIYPQATPSPFPNMSATALLQKAAQMGATMSKSNASFSSPLNGAHQQKQQQQQEEPAHAYPTSSTPPDQQHPGRNNSINGSSSGSGGFGLSLSSHEEMASAGFHHHHHVQGLVAPFGSNRAIQHMLMTPGSGGGFEGASSFEDAFDGILSSSSKKENNDIDTDGSNNQHEALKAATQGSLLARRQDVGGGNNEGLTRDFLGLRPLSHSDILSIAGLGNCMSTTSSQTQAPQKPWQA
ncbi:protein indeterminate-domain 7 [Rhodamnia argentea]|uniref:Protein indeterminate-domain 7 n=1 Tax=Rhodamnia argentea TaxID=178133 RepID=A0A8B8NX02_9MYRT|nr:protein indeterminate-domain 7 [Rhodamnia argentea]XP_030526295.1 protein indeterminate-domain 7 [Rhodamnia argentea]